MNENRYELRRVAYIGKYLLTLMTRGQAKPQTSLALYAKKTEPSFEQQLTRHQKRARKLQYGGMSTTRIPKNTLENTESSMRGSAETMLAVKNKKNENESWRDTVIRYAKPYGLQYDTLESFDNLVKEGWEQRDAAWGALCDWDLLEYEEEE